MSDNYFDEYTGIHDAMRLLWQAYEKAEGLPRLRRRIVSAIQYLRETAMDLIPYGAVTPNKDSHGRYRGRAV